MNQDEVFRIFDEMGAIITGTHVELPRGQHTSGWIKKSKIYENAERLSLLSRAIAEEFVGNNVQVVISGPAKGVIVLAKEVALHLTTLTEQEVFPVHAETSEDGQRVIINHRFARIITGKRVLVVVDVLMTGLSTHQIVRAVGSIGGRAIGVGTLCYRGDVAPRDMEVPKFKALMSVHFPTWDKDKCKRCEDKVPLVQMS